MTATKIIADEAHEFAESVINTIREPLIALDHDLRVVTASRSFYDFFKVKPEETVGQLIYDLGNKQWDIPKLRELLETILPQKITFDDYEVEHDFEAVGRRIMLLNARQIKRVWGKEQIILLAIEDITERKQLETLLEDSEQRYRRLFETANDGILLLEKRKGNIAQANPAIMAMLGYSYENFIGNSLKDVGFPDDIGTFQKILQTLEEDGILHYKDALLQKKTGKVIDADIYMVDKASLVQCNVRDITEHKRTKEKIEERLRKSEKKYRLIAEHMADIVTTMDMDLRFTYVSPSVKNLRGFTVKEALEQTIDQIMTPDSLQLVSRALEEELRLEATATAAPDRTRIMELEEYKKDGSIIWVESTLSFVRDKDQKPIGILAVSRDITQRKQAEQGLRKSEEKYRNILKNIDDGYFEVDIAGNFIFFNDAMCRMLGYSGSEMMGMNNRQYMDQENARKVFQTFNQVFITGEPVKTFDWEIIKKDGARRYVDTSVSLIMDSDGNAAGFRGVARDITDRKQLEAQLRQAQKMESVGRLAGGVAHDYNNALSVIIGFTEMAMDNADPAGPLRADLDEVLKAANRAVDITRQLLAFARKQIIAPVVLDLNENVEGMLKMLRRLIGEDIDLAWLPGAGLWPVRMDPSQIDQILANLCVNARDAIDGVGKVTIETGNVTFDKAYCADHAGCVPGEFVLLAVSDNGCGMEKETLDNIFEPFFTTKDVDKGTGLGLSTAYGIVKQNNGFINVYSEPGKGTTIRIYLPRQEEKAVSIQRESTAEIPQGRGETILVVEDDRPVLKLTQQILEGLGYTVLTAGTTKEAMDLAEEHAGEIDLLVTDVIMPEMNGRELAQHLQSRYPSLKRMFMSGYTANVVAHRGMLDKGAHFIQKPFSRRDLAITVRKALDESKIWL